MVTTNLFCYTTAHVTSFLYDSVSVTNISELSSVLNLREVESHIINYDQAADAI